MLTYDQGLGIEEGKCAYECSLCQLCEEDDIHVLFQCSFAREVWAAVGLIHLVTVWPNETVLTVLKRVSQIANRDQILMVYVLCWSIWQIQNDWVWNHVANLPFGVCSRACCMFTEWQRAKEDDSIHNTQQHTRVRTWCKPPEGWFKINVDASCVQGPGDRPGRSWMCY